MSETRFPALPVAVIGAGPVGLAAAAELIERNIPVLLLEAGDTVGAHIRRWAHVKMFSPWRFNLSRAATRLLEAEGWQAPPAKAVPTGAELISGYLDPLARHPAIASALLPGHRVLSISRVGLDKVRTAGRAERPFLLRVLAGGEERDLLAKAVIDCSGTFSQPNPAGGHGLPARGETALAGRILYGMPDLTGEAGARMAGKRVAVIGSGHSAIGALLDLLKLRRDIPETEILWLSRRADLRPTYGGGRADALPDRGALGSKLQQAVENGRIVAIHPFALEAIAEREGQLDLTGFDGRTVMVDELVVATGFRPDLSMLHEIRLDLDPGLECPRILAPLIDPNEHSCGTVRPHGAKELGQPEPGFYIAGMKSYGRAPTFLLATGYEQVRSIVAEIAGDTAAAVRVELELPETGVCSTDFASKALPTGSGCCGGPPKAGPEACCVQDEAAKAEGLAGCGCSAAKPERPALQAACC
ncbi:MAG: FAD-dependent oxidoreductase [Beijerinckiaceae bacterium]|nr:FAD-dependent oxidoreductase [Beijerinckiaceae bacterium]MCZ8300193.1 FAD-dependent oxidoreductase [Beijerinckiaceae bacterium]